MHVPDAGRRPVDGIIGLAIAVIVSYHGLVTVGAVLGHERRVSAGAATDPKLAGRRPVDRYVRLAVSVKVGRAGYILRQAPVSASIRSVTAPVDEENTA